MQPAAPDAHVRSAATLCGRADRDAPLADDGTRGPHRLDTPRRSAGGGGVRESIQTGATGTAAHLVANARKRADRDAPSARELVEAQRRSGLVDPIWGIRRRRLLASAAKIRVPIGFPFASSAPTLIVEPNPPQATERSHARPRKFSTPRLVLVLLALSAIGFTGLGSASEAAAASTHAFLFTFSGTEVPEAEFRQPVGIAITQASHDVYVLDAGGGPDGLGAVDVMTESGQLVSQITDVEVLGRFGNPNSFAVSNSSATQGRVYVEAGGELGGVLIFDSSGTFIGELTGAEVPGAEGTLRATGIAVDDAGSIYVSNSKTGRIDKFSASAHFLGEVGEIQSREQLAVNPEGDIFTIASVQGGPQHVSELSPSGAEVGVIDAEARPTGITVDPVTGDVYVTHRAYVNQYDAAGSFISRYGASNIQAAGGIAADAELEDTFVVDAGPRDVAVFGPTALGADATTATCLVPHQTEATFTGSINPVSKTLPATFQFEYGTTAEYGLQAPATAQSVGTGTTPQAVDVTVEGLTPNTEYHYRLLAFNGNGRTEGADRTCVTPGPPLIQSTTVTDVTSGTALLSAEIAAGGADTHYVFEFGGTTAYELGSVPAAPGGSIGSSHEIEKVAQELAGLLPATTYHLRVTATSAQGVSHGEDVTFTTFATARGLPDGRGYEIVSPFDKEDGEVFSTGGWVVPGNQTAGQQPFQSSPDGDAVTYAGDAASAGNGVSGNEYLARRTATGWRATDLSPVNPGPSGRCPAGSGIISAPIAAFSEDLSKAFLVTAPSEALAAATGAPPCFASPFLRDNESNSYAAALKAPPPDREPDHFGFGVEASGLAVPARMFAGGSVDLQRAFFAANDALAAPASDGGELGNNLYETAPNGELHVVNILPGGASVPNATFGSAPLESASPPNATRAISSDGRRAVWTDLNFPPKLYIREDGRSTVQVDAPQGGPDEGGHGRYWTASSDGSRVYFTDTQRLTRESTASPEEFIADLYEFNAVTGKLTDLTGRGPVANVNGVVATNNDGSYVYFVASGDLAPGAAGEEPHLYLWHEGVTTYIATLSAADNEFSGDLFPSHKMQVGDWVGNIANTTARVTPDGRHLVFMALEQLTQQATGGQSEVYVYSADEGSLTCESCLPTGGAASAPSVLFPSETNGFQPRWITDDGKKVFFDSKQALVASDKNSSWDVYEGESGGPHLISGGTDPGGSVFDDATANGSNVFFTSRESLVGNDTDQQTDLYDARVGGGFEAEPPAVACSGEACRGTQPTAPSIPFAASTSVGLASALAPLVPAARPIPKVPTRAQRLADALRRCKQKARRKRAACVRHARQLYGKRASKRRTRR
jgi:hypothetical protein